MESPTNCTALIKATVQSDLDAVRALLAAGADPNEQEVNGRSGLMEAARWGLDEIFRALLDAGGRVDLQDMNGHTALINTILRL